jgi:hypothetical protein
MAGGAFFLLRPGTLSIGPLLTATSILTGLTFTLALRFWERSVDARRDPLQARDGKRLTLLDRMKSHLVWTVIIGVLSTLILTLSALFVDPACVPTSVGVVTSFAVVYQISLVAGALLEFYRASYDLR